MRAMERGRARRFTFVPVLAALSACGPGTPAATPHGGPRVTFENDVAFLEKYGAVDVLEGPNGGRVALSAKYQGRVMTSAVGAGARSLGFIHRSFVEEGKTGTKFDNYGGEDRFWIGPEGGQFGFYFAPGKPFDFSEWQTPHDLQEGEWEVIRKTPTERAYAHRMKVTNWRGKELAVDVARSVRLLDASEVSAHIGESVPPGVSWVAFESANQITNAGREAWTEQTGLPSIWILGMFAPASDARIVIPFDSSASGPVVNDRYFGKVPSSRLRVHEREGFLVMEADGEYRSKIGVGPARAKGVAGSYCASQSLLTIVQMDEVARGAKFVNSMWEKQSEPFSGDVVNAYNDGPPAPGKPSLGGFYELETSSPAAALQPGDSLAHTHRTLHFVGDKEGLEAIAKKVLGVSLAQIEE
jgi:hypothetical protein